MLSVWLQDIDSREDDTGDNERHRPLGRSNSSIVVPVGAVNDAGDNRHNRGGRSDRSTNGGGSDDDWRRSRRRSSRSDRSRRRGSDGGGRDSGCGGCSGGRGRGRRSGSSRSGGGFGGGSSGSTGGSTGGSSSSTSGCGCSRELGVLVKAAFSRGDRDADGLSDIEVQAVLSQLLVPLEEIVKGDAVALSKVIAGGVRCYYYWDRGGYREKQRRRGC